MAADTAIARALVTALDGGSYSKTPTVSYSFDDVLDADALTGAEIKVCPFASSHELAGRAGWHDDAEIRVTIAGPQHLIDNGTENVDDVEAWLTFANEIKTAIKTATPEGQRSVEITEAERFDPEALRNQNLFRTTIICLYKAIED